MSVVIPTFNERDNIAPLLSRLESALGSITSEVIFVDDSDDGTAALIRERPNAIETRVIHRGVNERGGGLSTAVLRGIDAARGRYVCVMDGDLQHPPEAIPALYARADATHADVVIASRNVAGGTNSGLDGRWRRVVSWGFGMVSRVLFYEKLRHVTDPLSGFLLVRRSALTGIAMRPVGYKISLEILIRAAGSHVEEVPYAFAERTAGETKARIGTGMTFIRHVGLLLLEVPEVGRFWKFAAVGGTGLLVYMALLWALTAQVGLHYGVAWAVAAETAVISNFSLNRNVTWFERRAEGVRNFAIEFAKYHAASAVSVAANGLVFFILTRAGVDVLLAGAISVWVGVATSFLGAEKFVFTTRRSAVRRRVVVPIAEDSASTTPTAAAPFERGADPTPGSQEGL